MAISYYFFDAKNVGGTYDRTYSSGDFARYLEGLVGSGVFPIPSNSLQVYAGTGMQVLVRPGMGWINGHKMISDADVALTLDAADVTLNRIDRIVFRLDMTQRTMGIYVKKGTNASSPTAPTIERTQNIVEYSLATVTINRQTTQVSASMIRDTRLDSSVCGMVQGLIQQVDTSTLFNQWNAAYDQQYEEYTGEFESWFATIKDTLSTVVMWQEYKNVVTTTSTSTQTVSIGIPQYNHLVDILNVYINGMRLASNEYTHDETTVTFAKTLDVVGTTIEFVVYKSVNGENAESVVGQVTQLQTDLSDMQSSLRQPTQLYEGTFTPLSSGAINYLNLSSLDEYDIVIARVTIGSIGEEMVYFYKGTATNGRINQTVSVYLNSSTYGTATIQYDNTNNRIGIRSEAVQGWTVSQVNIRKVWGIKL